MIGKVTLAGYNRQKIRVEEARRAHERCVADLNNDRGGENSIGEAKAADNALVNSQKEIAHRKWIDEEQQLRKITAVHRPPKDCHASVGNRIEFKWLEASARKKKGAHETVILGGIGETWDGDDLGDGKHSPPTISCNSPLGQALKGSEAGEEVIVHCPGKENLIKVISFTTPRLALIEKAA